MSCSPYRVFKKKKKYPNSNLIFMESCLSLVNIDTCGSTNVTSAHTRRCITNSKSGHFFFFTFTRSAFCSQPRVGRSHATSLWNAAFLAAGHCFWCWRTASLACMQPAAHAGSRWTWQELWYQEPPWIYPWLQIAGVPFNREILLRVCQMHKTLLLSPFCKLLWNLYFFFFFHVKRRHTNRTCRK